MTHREEQPGWTSRLTVNGVRTVLPNSGDGGWQLGEEHPIGPHHVGRHRDDRRRTIEDHHGIVRKSGSRHGKEIPDDGARSTDVEARVGHAGHDGVRIIVSDRDRKAGGLGRRDGSAMLSIDTPPTASTGTLVARTTSASRASPAAGSPGFEAVWYTFPYTQIVGSSSNCGYVIARSTERPTRKPAGTQPAGATSRRAACTTGP